jgi:hypothetical protein
MYVSKNERTSGGFHSKCMSAKTSALLVDFQMSLIISELDVIENVV